MTFALPAPIEILRPRQWLKNGIVMAGFLFALADKGQSIEIAAASARCLAALALFCGVSSAVYIMNDLHDAEEDRAHPEKKTRPIASGRLGARVAVAECAALLAAAGLIAVLYTGHEFAKVLGAYFLMQTAYTFALKRLVLVDVITIAAGFVLRVYAGTVAAGVTASVWLLICTFAVALFIALCKRYNERITLGDGAAKHRKVLGKYEPRLLSRIITATAALTIICYAIYTLSGATVEKFGHRRLVATVPFVMFGMFRYAYLVFRTGKGGHPERVVTTDIPTIVNFLLYAAVCVFVLAIK